MPFLYIYSPSDFVSGLPDEHGAAAAGRGPFNLTLSPTAEPTVIEVSDDDGVIDEVDGNQTLVSDVTVDGTSYSAGTSVNTAYDLINTSTGHKLTSLHMGGDGYQQGAVDGVISTEPLVAGQTYTFNRERTSHRQANNYEDYVACFVAGTLIETIDGPVAVEDLAAGDLVRTKDGTSKPLRLRLHREISRADLVRNPQLRPVRITAGALGAGLPRRDLLVSPQHRMLANSPICGRMFGEQEVFLAAAKLTAMPGIYVDDTIEALTYFHLVFDAHEVIFSEGAPTESFCCGEMAMAGLTPEARAEILKLFPKLKNGRFQLKHARPLPENRMQKIAVMRHYKNKKAMIH